MHGVTEVFHKKFCGGIRVAFNWRRFFVEDWPIEIIPLVDRQTFAGLQLPWYMRENAFVAFDALDASPICLGKIREWYPLLPAKQRNAIDEMKGEYLCGSRVPEFEFPAYTLPKSE
jgi:hypothetical protein